MTKEEFLKLRDDYYLIQSGVKKHTSTMSIIDLVKFVKNPRLTKKAKIIVLNEIKYRTDHE